MYRTGARDRISQLPDEVLDYILLKLKLRDAVRASLLSSRWRHVVMSRDRLAFDWSNLFKTREKSDLWEASKKDCVCLEYKDRYVQAVNQFLASYKGTKIRLFKVRFCLNSECRHDVSNWMRFALDLGVKELRLKSYCTRFKTENPRGFSRFKVPFELLQSRQPIIKCLRLTFCDPPRTLTHHLFRQLEFLKLQLLYLDSYDMQSLLGSLVNLKVLSMRRCTLPPYLSLKSLTNLEDVLLLGSCRLKKIDVANLKLKSFKVYGKKNVSWGFTGAPNLEQFSYGVHDHGLRSIFAELPKFLPRLKKLCVFSVSNWVEYIPESIATFSNLKTLGLALDQKMGDIMFKIVHLLRAFPVLHTLTIVLSSRDDKEHKKLESIEYIHKSLKVIVIDGFVGTMRQIESSLHLLKHAPRVKVLELRHNLPYLLSHVSKFGYRSHPINEEERENVLRVLRAFSKDVKVVFR